MNTYRTVQHCSGCQVKFKTTATRYYCCDSGELFCWKCRNGLCMKCKKSHFRQIRLVPCSYCKNSESQQIAFNNYKQDDKLCVDCVQVAYARSIVHQNSIVQFGQKKVWFSTEQIEDYLKNYCWSCYGILPSNKFIPTKNIKFLFCQKCEDFLKEHDMLQKKAQKLKEYIHSVAMIDRKTCNACNGPIFNNSGFITEDFMLCESCVRLSSVAEEKAWNHREEDIMQPRRKRSEDMMEEMEMEERYNYKDDQYMMEDYGMDDYGMDDYGAEDIDMQENQDNKSQIFKKCSECPSQKAFFEYKEKVLCANCRFSSDKGPK